MSPNPVRRVVTGHDEKGRAIIAEDGPAPRVVEIGGARGTVFTELWHTAEMPARIERRTEEPVETGVTLAPPANGTRIRIVDFPPEEEAVAADVSPEEARALFAAIGAADASRHRKGARHPFMHRTETIDYGIVLAGEITLLVDEGETHLRAGDIVVQRGTNHAWSNRSGQNCRMCFVLVDGEFDAELKDL